MSEEVDELGRLEESKDITELNKMEARQIDKFFYYSNLTESDVMKTLNASKNQEFVEFIRT